jgi:hypothetical protein
MKSFTVTLPEDDRNYKPLANKGVYYIYKKNWVAQFCFGGSHSFDNIDQAYNAMHLWLKSRKDADKLRITLILDNR